MHCRPQVSDRLGASAISPKFPLAPSYRPTALLERRRHGTRTDQPLASREAAGRQTSTARVERFSPHSSARISVPRISRGVAIDDDAVQCGERRLYRVGRISVRAYCKQKLTRCSSTAKIPAAATGHQWIMPSTLRRDIFDHHDRFIRPAFANGVSGSHRRPPTLWRTAHRTRIGCILISSCVCSRLDVLSWHALYRITPTSAPVHQYCINLDFGERRRVVLSAGASSCVVRTRHALSSAE
ncbi:hypothetical protein BDW22DRAFT_140959 [Trametopsis cervina]|nr:hypothetical protein BDW22DRAFT_140959 [Trametopsis cervina]